jgi:hypothetical protein
MSEYIPSEHEKVFELKRKEDPDRLLAVRLRETVCDDGNVGDGAARLFVRLLDLSLNPTINGGYKGQVICSQLKLATLLHRDTRSVRRWANELAAANYVWLSHVARPDTKPISCWHITAFQPKQPLAQIVPGEGLFGNGKRRYDAGFSKTGLEASGQKRRSQNGLVDRFGKPILFDLAQKSPASGQKWPRPADKIDRCQGTGVSSASGQNCPEHPDTAVRSQRPKLSGGSGQNCPDAGVPGVPLRRDSVGVRVPIESKGEGSPAPAGGFEASIKGEFRSRLVKMEADLAKRVDSARSAEARATWSARLRAVRIELVGGEVQDDPPKPKAARKAPEPPKALSEGELLESARAAVALGVVNLTKGQRDALQLAGELPEALWKGVK